MMEGEYESMKVLYSVTPHFCPKPLTHGTFKSNSDLHFFLCDFREMDDELPDLKKFCASLAQMHRDSVSPEDKFGLHTQTYNGNIPQDVRWTDTWEECLINGTKLDFELEREARGASEDLDALIGPLFEKVIPRLLRPLETGRRKLKPCFVHGDLWYGNGWLYHDFIEALPNRLLPYEASNDAITGEPMVFDAAGFYGHNECK
jgi:protein-ribulosamine 3-kinase